MDAPSSGIEALDELLDLPHLNVLLCGILTHFGCKIALESRPLYKEEGELVVERTREGKGRKRKRFGVEVCPLAESGFLQIFVHLSEYPTLGLTYREFQFRAASTASISNLGYISSDQSALCELST